MFAKVKLTIIFFSALVVAYAVVGGMMEKVSARDEVYRGLSIFTEVISKVKEEYVETPDMDKATKGALHGMMEALDPYSSFLDAKTYDKVQERNEAYKASPGLILSKRYGYGYVVSVVPGSPAQREGLRSGDLIESIDGHPTTQMSLLEAQSLMLGPTGSTVRLNLIRARRAAPAEVKLSREELARAEPSVKRFEDEIGLLRIDHFHPGTSDSVQAKLKLLQSSGIRGLLIDIRGAAEGALEEAVKVADLFLSKGTTIVKIENREGKQRTQESISGPSLSGIPVVLLVDAGTSGSAEVFAAALQDHKVAEVVGEKTNGQGSSQETFFLEDESVLFVSTEAYYRPDGRPLQAENLKNSGVTPEVRSPSDDFVTNFYYENTTDDLEKSLNEVFYQKLNEAIESEQLNSGLERVRSKALKKAA